MQFSACRLLALGVAVVSCRDRDTENSDTDCKIEVMTGLYLQCSVHPVSQTFQPLCSYVNVYSRVWSAHQDITVGCVTGARKTTTEEVTHLKHCLQVYSSTICYVLQTTSLHDRAVFYRLIVPAVTNPKSMSRLKSICM